MNLSKLVQERYTQWSEDPFFDEETRQELIALKGDPREINERFYRKLSFGTGGLRGLLGAGMNRMNVYTIAHATEGFARYIESLGDEAKQRGVAISYDSRWYSDVFAKVTAGVFAQHGIHVYLFDELRPTPLLSFAVRYYGCVGGVMITASHNPKDYNGYKAYGEDGGQMPPEAADAVYAVMEEIEDMRTIETMSIESALREGYLHIVGPEMDVAYMQSLDKLRINREIPQQQSDMKIVYTPLHGAGNKSVRRILKHIGFDQVYTVPEQMLPDGAFPTVDSPNPENRSALQMAIDLASKEEASLVIATDPDSDRTGLAVRQADGSYDVLSGNQIGLMLMDYILSAKQANGTLEPKSFVATTIVSTRLAQAVADRYGVQLFTVLTGFKYIGELIKNHDENGDMHFQFGFEESFGYLAGTDVRDKDAVVASMLIAEMAATARSEGKTLSDRITEFYRTYGFGKEAQFSIQQEGQEGAERIKALLKLMREEGQDALGDLKVNARCDYGDASRVSYLTGETETLTLPSSDVLLYELEGRDWICLRPSGTEPKIKVYYGAYDEDLKACDERLAHYETYLKALMDQKLKQL